jgi:hypothetical protein
MSVSSPYRNLYKIPGFQHILDKLEQFFGVLNLPEKAEELKRITGTITA